MVGPGVLRLGWGVLGLHVHTGHRAGPMGKGRRPGRQAEGGTSPACKGSRDPHPALSSLRLVLSPSDNTFLWFVLHKAVKVQTLTLQGAIPTDPQAHETMLNSEL